jgi:2-polyprenyl-3-methyl-5-hydroxy-6-metoxy-1,4-benzoquinol methylase
MSLLHRAEDLRELMDDPACDAVRLANTYRQFDTMNRWLTGWRGIYRRMIAPSLSRHGGPATLLDVGCGGGGLVADLCRWASSDGYVLRGVGIDPDARAIAFARDSNVSPPVSFQCRSLEDAGELGGPFDFVVCNHVLHHLPGTEVPSFLVAMARLSSRLAIVEDTCRSRLAYLLFPVCTRPLFRDSFIVEDGRRSIRRAFRTRELRELAPESWRVRSRPPFRIELVYRPGREGE